MRSDNAEGVGASMLPIQIAIANGYFQKFVWQSQLRRGERLAALSEKI
jgi:hypothetical protein